MLPTRLKGARTHNLQGVDLKLEPGQVVAITGVSGAGKSSLALDTLYAEGQRRFVESFSPYARQFLERLERPPMTSLEPVPAGVAVDRSAPIKSSRSTVATMADLEPYLAALFTREARPVCPDHGVEAVPLDPEQAATNVLEHFDTERTVLTYPVRVAGTEPYLELRDQLVRDGYRRVWLKGEARDLDDVKPSEALEPTEGVQVVLDRIKATARDRSRLAAAIERGWGRAHGVVLAHAGDRTLKLSAGLSCPTCGMAFGEPKPGLFSYESPLGACGTCRGFGRVLGIDWNKVIPDVRKPLGKKAIRPWSGQSTTWERAELKRLCARHDIPMNVPWEELTNEQQGLVLEGDGDWDDGYFPGISGWFRWLETRTYKMHVRVLLARYRSYDPCPACHGQRLNPTALRYRVGGRNLADWHALEVSDALAGLDALEPRTGQGKLARDELATRLRYLDRVGLGYLSLDRQARTLSGGEAQRVTLTAALGTSLHNALFVLDEPTVGLHPSDVHELRGIIRELADRGNTVLVVEHEPLLIAAADRVVELGPGAGDAGGTIAADGTPAQLAKRATATARALAAAPARDRERRTPERWLTVKNARANNLRGIDVELPLGVLCAVTGPSGSGKSTLLVDIVYQALARRLGALDVDVPGEHDAIEGAEAIKKVALVDQSPLGRTSRGNAGTYTKAWDAIRKRFSEEAAARAAGLTASSFSFNVAAGRCEACNGEGYETVEMQFLADVHLVCPVCQGKRFQPHVLAVKHRGVSVADVLEMTVDEALQLFADDRVILRSLGPLARLGLGYLRIGQPLSTLSGGEAQRLKLARTLNESHRKSLVVLDEPSAGLHADEVAKVLDALELIVSAGGSVFVVEHDLGFVRAADWVVDLGPDAGARGGDLVTTGAPEGVAATDTRTGRALRDDGAVQLRSGKARRQPSAALALTVSAAREHNLQGVDVAIPHGALTVVTGPSGSGKSSLAFDVVFAEGQRRFLETLTPYARRFLPKMPRPDVDAVVGVPPSIALEQRTSRAGPRSTVATVTEVSHYLRLLYAKLGIVHCPDHDEPVHRVDPATTIAELRKLKGKWSVLAPVVQARKGTYLDVFAGAARDGIAFAYCDGELVDCDRPPRLKKTQEHTIDLILSGLEALKGVDDEVFEKALRWGRGAIKVRNGKGDERLLSTVGACPVCGFSPPELDPRWFSFNTKQGQCDTCEGTGVVDEAGTVTYKRRGRKRTRKKKGSDATFTTCPTCDGTRLAPIPRGVRLHGERYHELTGRSVGSAHEHLATLELTGNAAKVGGPVLRECLTRLRFLDEVGLAYLSLDRAARTLSGGEMQRLRLAAQLGAGLTGAMYILDEPTIGLHPRDTQRLLGNLTKLVKLGSTVVVVEHDEDTIRAADHLVDLGPTGGRGGGRIMAAGKPAKVLATADSPTGQVLREPLALREPLPTGEAAWVELSGVSEHNLKDVTLRVPRGHFTVVAGVSGSGKSTLVRQVLLPAVRQHLGLEAPEPGAHAGLGGLDGLKRALAVDQSPIGRTPRSVPATFLGIWDEIRRIFAATPDAQVAGFGPARFSFNTASGGRCPTCEGQGVVTHEMSFLPDVVTDCPACDGLRFEPRTLAVEYLGLSIGEVLKLSAADACEVFTHHPKITRSLKTLVDLGAGYVALGQGSHTLSGGEAQRLKLADELTAGARHEPTLYVLDEPTTGLHLGDVGKLVEVLGRLVERGDTLVVIEHHPQVIAGADWVVELGPEGGQAGGRIVAEGPPATVAKKKTATGAVLKGVVASTAGKKTGRRRKAS